MSLSRFKGCLVGAVVADCLGSLFEGRPTVKVTEILQAIEKKFERPRALQKQAGVRPADVYGLKFTDDTAMARSVAASLLDKNGFDAKDMAHRFASEFDKEPNRGYGGNIGTVFNALLDPQLEDVFQPAAAQFNGSGSYGNGGAMRISPAPLFTFHQPDSSVKLKDLVDSVTRLTHTNPFAIHGAMLEAFAVDQALRLQQETEVNADEFIDSLIEKMKPIEEDTEPPAKKIAPKRPLDAEPNPYCAKLEKIKEFVKKDDLGADEVKKVLGNDVSALGSVPAAVLSFLRTATKNQKGMEEKNKFEQTVIYAISLGGDTDTIGTMAAAMAGAFYGIESVPESWQYYCEGVADAETYAERFFEGGKVTETSNVNE